ncbi:S1 family peptidase [Lentzea sp. NPDC051213]|uniref:S1 family peptidase n=1 Tax=Lentzea sp. NPDC051213 TaxID=3364126 RepID=UPI0037AB1D6F
MSVRRATLALGVSVAALLAAAAPASAIIGGTVSKDAPWAVHMLVDGAPQCTGTAVAREWVLTATHCFKNIPDSAITFRVGSLGPQGGEVVRPIPDSRRGNDHTDMTLIKVPPMTVALARLAESGDLAAGKTITAYGWGATCTDGLEGGCQSPVLKQADLTVRPNSDQECRDERMVSDSPTEFCAARINGITAGGDSGGPAFLTRPDGSAVLVGVLSLSDRDHLASFGDVAYQRAWIQSVI